MIVENGELKVCLHSTFLLQDLLPLPTYVRILMHIVASNKTPQDFCGTADCR